MVLPETGPIPLIWLSESKYNNSKTLKKLTNNHPKYKQKRQFEKLTFGTNTMNL